MKYLKCVMFATDDAIDIIYVLLLYTFKHGELNFMKHSISLVWATKFKFDN